MRITVLSRSGREIIPGGVELSDDATVEELQAALQRHNKKWYPSRQRFTLPLKAGEKKAVALQAGQQLASQFVGQGPAAQVVFKDLGPQIEYKAVFFWEYFGPLLLYPLFYFFPQIMYPWAMHKPIASHSPVQAAALAYWSFHYAKRILETFLVHRFSHATMPIFNLFRNCTYYWSFAIFVSYFVNHPLFSAVPATRAYVALTASLVCQLANLYCHIILRKLRPPGSSGGAYQIPRGFLFNYITCANYFTEICGWIGFCVATQTLPAVLFLLAGGYQMTQWAIAKHKRLRRTFDGQDGRLKYPRGRWVIFPPLL